MKTAKDYPVTFKFGATTAPYSPSHPHLGEDRAMPSGTPVPVNGVVIGLAGSTGFSTGSHTHTQKVEEGQVVNPRGGGFDIPSPAVVIQTGTRSDIGNYVRVQDAKGVVWSYFHLSKIMVKKGQKLSKEDNVAEKYKGKTAKEWYKEYVKMKKLAENRAKRILAADKALAVGK
jgi:hypothetical protein